MFWGDLWTNGAGGRRAWRSEQGGHKVILSNLGTRNLFCNFFWARGKRRGFSPGAAARHSQSARVPWIRAKNDHFCQIFRLSPLALTPVSAQPEMRANLATKLTTHRMGRAWEVALWQKNTKKNCGENKKHTKKNEKKLDPKKNRKTATHKKSEIKKGHNNNACWKKSLMNVYICSGRFQKYLYVV